MYQTIDKSEQIYLYNVHKEQFIAMFPTKQDALKFLAANTFKNDWLHKETNIYLDHINMGNDIEVHYQGKSFFDDETLRYFLEKIVTQREYLFIDGLERIIDFREYYKEILRLRNTGDMDYAVYPTKKKKRKWIFYDIPYEFRKDPVPYRGKRGTSRPYRMPKVHNLYKQVVDNEDKKFVRAKRNRNNLPNIYWDDAPLRSRYKSRSWKDCSKREHQWK